MISKEERYGNTVIVMISDTGIGHRVHNTVNQDAIDFFMQDEDYAFVISDGVGSCRLADVGAKAAVKAVGEVFQNLENETEESDMQDIIDRIINEWFKQIRDERPEECCATLKTVIKKKNKLMLFSIGDGLLIVTSEGMNVIAPSSDDLFANQTICLGPSVRKSDFWSHEFALDTYVNYTVFLCSDGVGNGIQEGRESELVNEIEKDVSIDDLQGELEGLVQSIADVSIDDRTVGVIKYDRKNA